MHLIITTFGTDGDVLPLLGLGATLRARGHRVTLVSNEHVKPLAQQHGLSFECLISDQEYREAISHPDMWHPIKSALVGARWAIRFLDRQYTLLERVSRTGDCRLVASPAVLAARMLQEKRNIPLVSVLLQPWMVASLSAPPVMAGGLSLPAWAPKPLGLFYWRLVNAMGDLLVGREFNRSRAAIGLPPVRKLFEYWLSPDLVLGMFPDWYGPPQKDWPSQLKLTGFPLFDGSTGGRNELRPSLQAFCEAGPPPVAFTFGTGMLRGHALFQDMKDVCESLDCRGLFLTRHGEQLPSVLPETIRHEAFAPFHLLFSRCGAVVHHGGIGTMSQAMAAGLPQLILPMAFDQYDNATRVRSLGVGDWQKPNRRSINDIVNVLQTIQTGQIVDRCLKIMRRQLKQNGLEKAADQIEAM